MKSTSQILNDRTCFITKQKLPKEKLLRFSYDKFNNQVILDRDKKLLNRGFYITNEKKYIELLLKKKIIQKKYNLSLENSNFLEMQLKELIK